MLYCERQEYITNAHNKGIIIYFEIQLHCVYRTFSSSWSHYMTLSTSVNRVTILRWVAKIISEQVEIGGRTIILNIKYQVASLVRFLIVYQH